MPHRDGRNGYGCRRRPRQSERESNNMDEQQSPTAADTVGFRFALTCDRCGAESGTIEVVPPGERPEQATLWPEEDRTAYLMANHLRGHGSRERPDGRTAVSRGDGQAAGAARGRCGRAHLGTVSRHRLVPRLRDGLLSPPLVRPGKQDALPAGASVLGPVKSGATSGAPSPLPGCLALA